VNRGTGLRRGPWRRARVVPLQKRAGNCGACGRPYRLHFTETSCPGETAARAVEVAVRNADRAVGAARRAVAADAPTRDVGPVRDDRFKRWVKAHRCICCGRTPDQTTVDPDHIGRHPVGRRTDDTRCVPVCRWCHTFRTTNGYLPLKGRRTLQVHQARAQTAEGKAEIALLKKRTRLVVAEASVELLVEYYKRKEAGSGAEKA
jgi:hypothetical protein